MTDREYQKMIADARRGVSRKNGFRQSSYINFKVEDGYFFCLYFLTDVRLTVKPMYADDLWWDIWESTENKNEPLLFYESTFFRVRQFTRLFHLNLE